MKLKQFLKIIGKMFPQQTNFVLKYMDAQEDYITIDSLFAWQEAIRFSLDSPNSLLRLQLRFSDSVTQNSFDFAGADMEFDDSQTPGQQAEVPPLFPGLSESGIPEPVPNFSEHIPNPLMLDALLRGSIASRSSRLMLPVFWPWSFFLKIFSLLAQRWFLRLWKVSPRRFSPSSLRRPPQCPSPLLALLIMVSRPVFITFLRDIVFVQLHCCFSNSSLSIQRCNLRWLPRSYCWRPLQGIL